MQPEIDFTQVLHKRENNPESEKVLKENQFHFVGQCAIIKSLLEKGVHLTTLSALFTYKIGDLQARIRDLRDAGLPIEDKRFIDETGKKTRYKEYFLKTETS